MICFTPEPSQSFFISCIQSKNKILKKRFYEKAEWRIEQKNQKKAF